MPGIINTELGTISIPDEIVATIAGYAASENYGIVGMHAKTTGDQLWKLVGGDNQRRGVKVTCVEGDQIDIDLFVTIKPYRRCGECNRQRALSCGGHDGT